MKINPIGVNPSVSPKSTDAPKHSEATTESVSVSNVRSNEISAGLKKVEAGENAHEAVNDEILDKSVEQANKSLAIYNRRIERNVHEVTKTVMYQIKDTNTDEVIREFPPKKIQDMIAKMWELAGLFVDEKA